MQSSTNNYLSLFIHNYMHQVRSSCSSSLINFVKTFASYVRVFFPFHCLFFQNFMLQPKQRHTFSTRLRLASPTLHRESARSQVKLLPERPCLPLSNRALCSKTSQSLVRNQPFSSHRTCWWLTSRFCQVYEADSILKWKGIPYFDQMIENTDESLKKIIICLDRIREKKVVQCVRLRAWHLNKEHG